MNVNAGPTTWLQVREEFGATHCAQGLRRMAAELGSDPLSDSQLVLAKTLAERLVAYRDQVRALDLPPHPTYIKRVKLLGRKVGDPDMLRPTCCGS